MDREIGHNCNGSLLALDSINCWDTLEISNKDIDSLGPSISQEQLLSIVDFSLEWACTGIETKVQFLQHCCFLFCGLPVVLFIFLLIIREFFWGSRFS